MAFAAIDPRRLSLSNEVAKIGEARRGGISRDQEERCEERSIGVVDGLGALSPNAGHRGGKYA
jgi:hypothetical protein